MILISLTAQAQPRPDTIDYGPRAYGTVFDATGFGWVPLSALPDLSEYETGDVVLVSNTLYLHTGSAWAALGGSVIVGETGATNDFLIEQVDTIPAGTREYAFDIPGATNPAAAFYDSQFAIGFPQIDVLSYGGRYDEYAVFTHGETVGSHAGFILFFAEDTPYVITIRIKAKLIPASGILWADLPADNSMAQLRTFTLQTITSTWRTRQ